MCPPYIVSLEILSLIHCATLKTPATFQGQACWILSPFFLFARRLLSDFKMVASLAMFQLAKGLCRLSSQLNT